MAPAFQATENLPSSDQMSFNQYGRGAELLVPFKLVHEAFESIVHKQPDIIAVEHDGQSLTYHELDRAANALANRLIDMGLVPQQRVCLVVQRSLEMIIAVLAVLKCACQFVPLDGSVITDSALIHVLEDTKTSFVLCLDRFQEKVRRLADPTAMVVALDVLEEICESFERPDVKIQESDGAYAIYTSGTSDSPKGVDVIHENVTNLLCCYPGNIGISRGTTVAQLLSISFDMGQWGILGTLLNGGTLLIRTRDCKPVLEKVHTLICTPSILGTFLRNEYPNIKTVALAGEPCPKALVDDWAKQATVYNCCGPTEVTIVNKLHQHEPPLTAPCPSPSRILKPEVLKLASPVLSPEQEEMGVVVEPLSFSSPGSSRSAGDEFIDDDFALPPKKGRHGLRALQHRIFSLYRRFFSVVLAANLIAVFLVLQLGQEGLGLQNIATAVAANLACAVLMRQEVVINLLFKIACSVPTSWPLFVRRNLAKVYHIGGLHSGCAVAATVWLIIFTILATVDNHRHPAVLVVSYMLVCLLSSMVVSAHPSLRQRYHDRFELIHRFAGWSALVLFWAQTLVVTYYFRNPSKGLGMALIASPGFWLLVIATCSIILPWLKFRKVAVRCDVLSSHAVRMCFKYNHHPAAGTAIRLSESPLVEWHAFAAITNPEEDEFSVIVSNAGDWTAKQIQKPPTKLYVRGIPACGVLHIAPLFKSLVLVATGSGIGPCLAVIYARKVPCRIFWSTPNPEETFGQDILDVILEVDPHAVIHNTRTMGRPDMVAVTWKLLRESGAEAVTIISNKKLTQMVIYAMETRGVPAYGAIFDS